MLSRLQAWPTLVVVAAVVFCGVFAMQYPLQTTFPIGGDAVRHLTRATDVWHHPLYVLRNSNYPASVLVLASSVVVPLSWPERFIWVVVAAHLATALALGWLLYRHFGWRQAAVGIAVWGLVTTGITRHIEDGTLAQLLSLPAVLLCLERFIAMRLWVSGGLFILAGLLHPFSAVFLAGTIILTVLTRLPQVRRLVAAEQKLLIVWGIGLLVLILVGWWHYWNTLQAINYGDTIDLAYLRTTHFAPALLLAPLGYLLLCWRERLTIRAITLTAAACTSLILSLTHTGGLTPLAHRFGSYLILSAIIGFSVLLPVLLPLVFRSRGVQILFTFILFTTLAAASWQANAFVYDFYETQGKYARVHPDELASMEWMRDHLPPSSIVATTNANRHSEWIPVIAQRSWIGFDRTEDLLRDTTITHAAFFRHREKTPAPFDGYEPLYRNDGATVFALPRGRQQ